MTEHCAAFTALLVRAAEDVLPAEDRARLDTHLLDCPARRGPVHFPGLRGSVRLGFRARLARHRIFPGNWTPRGAARCARRRCR